MVHSTHLFMIPASTSSFHDTGHDPRSLGQPPLRVAVYLFVMGFLTILVSQRDITFRARSILSAIYSKVFSLIAPVSITLAVTSSVMLFSAPSWSSSPIYALWLVAGKLVLALPLLLVLSFLRLWKDLEDARSTSRLSIRFRRSSVQHVPNLSASSHPWLVPVSSEISGTPCSGSLLLHQVAHIDALRTHLLVTQEEERDLWRRLAEYDECNKRSVKHLATLQQDINIKDEKLGMLEYALEQAQRMIEDKDWAIGEAERMIMERVSTENATLSDHEKALQKVNRRLARRDAYIAELKAAITERDVAIAEKDAVIALRDVDISSKDTTEANAISTEKDTIISEAHATVASQRVALVEANATIASKDAVLSELIATIAEKDSKILALEDSVVEKKAKICEKGAVLIERDAALRSLEADVQELCALLDVEKSATTRMGHLVAIKDAAIEDLKLALDLCSKERLEYKDAAAALEVKVVTFDAELLSAHEDKAIAERDQIIAERDVIILRLKDTISIKDDIICKHVATLAEKDAIACRQDAVVREKDVTIAQQLALISRKDAVAEEQAGIIRRKDVTIVERDIIIAGRDAVIAGREAAITSLSAAMQELQAAVQEKEALLTAKENVLRDQKAEAASLSEAQSVTIKQLTMRVNSLGQEIADKWLEEQHFPNTKIEELTRANSELKQTLVHQRRELAERTILIVARDEMISELTKSLEATNALLRKRTDADVTNSAAQDDLIVQPFGASLSTWSPDTSGSSTRTWKDAWLTDNFPYYAQTRMSPRAQELAIAKENLAAATAKAAELAGSLKKADDMLDFGASQMQMCNAERLHLLDEIERYQVEVELRVARIKKLNVQLDKERYYNGMGKGKGKPVVLESDDVFVSPPDIPPRHGALLLPGIQRPGKVAAVASEALETATRRTSSWKPVRPATPRRALGEISNIPQSAAERSRRLSKRAGAS